MKKGKKVPDLFNIFAQSCAKILNKSGTFFESGTSLCAGFGPADAVPCAPLSGLVASRVASSLRFS